VWQDANSNGVMDSAEISRIESLGEKEYMYLTDRSYCAKAPQQSPAGPGGAFDAQFNGRINPDYIPPRVWRMSIPRYPGYGG
jgi:hypothetical protein